MFWPNWRPEGFPGFGKRVDALAIISSADPLTIT
jgi:hypothetical protein